MAKHANHLMFLLLSGFAVSGIAISLISSAWIAGCSIFIIFGFTNQITLYSLFCENKKIPYWTIMQTFLLYIGCPPVTAACLQAVIFPAGDDQNRHRKSYGDKEQP